MICKKGVLEKDIFTDEQGNKYKLANLISPDAIKCYILLKKLTNFNYWVGVRMVCIND